MAATAHRGRGRPAIPFSASRLGNGLSLGAPPLPDTASAGDQPPDLPQHEEDGEGDREANRPKDQQEDDEGDDRQWDEEEFHGPVVLQWQWEQRQHSRPSWLRSAR